MTTTSRKRPPPTTVFSGLNRGVEDAVSLFRDESSANDAKKRGKSLARRERRPRRRVRPHDALGDEPLPAAAEADGAWTRRADPAPDRGRRGHARRGARGRGLALL